MPPVAPVRSASHGIEQMDHIQWEDVYHSPFTTVEDIPAELQVEFARATATVLNSAMTARRQGDEPNATRWLKCWRLFGQLMLRVPPRGGRRGHAILPARFAAFAQGDFKRLVDWWEHDRAHHQPRGAVGRQQQEEAQTKRAVRMVGRFCLSKAARLLTSQGVADWDDARVREQMNSKFPDRKAQLPSSLDGYAAFEPPTELKIDETIGLLPRGTATGPDGMRVEYFKALCLPYTCGRALRGLEAFTEFAELFAADALPAWYYYAATAATLMPIIKEPSVNPAHAPDARPVQMGNIELRIIGRAVTRHFHGDLEVFFEPQQLGATTKGGLDVLVHIVRMHLVANPAHVCVKLDIRNMFNEIEREAIIRVFEAQPRLRDMVPFLYAVHSPQSLVYYPDGRRADKSCAEGTRQGSSEAGIAACAAIQEPLEAADAALSATGGFARADFDDTYLCGEPAEVARVLVEFETAIAAVGAELQRPKSAALLGATCVLDADFPVPVGVLRHSGPVPQHGQVIGYGIKVAGIPLGDAAFVEETLKRKGDKLELKFDQVTSRLEAAHGWQLFSILRYCLRPTGDYFARLLFPSDAEPLMERIDDLVTATAQASFGQDISPQGPLGQRAAELLAKRMRLPKRMDGTGLRSLLVLSRTTAFVAATLDALPRMADRRVGAGRQLRRGLAPWLSGVLGDDAFDDGNEHRRLAPFLQHGGRTAS